MPRVSRCRSLQPPSPATALVDSSGPVSPCSVQTVLPFRDQEPSFLSPGFSDAALCDALVPGGSPVFATHRDGGVNVPWEQPSHTVQRNASPVRPSGSQF